MRYVSAYLLSAASGIVPCSEHIEKIISSVGIDFDAEKANIVINEMKGKTVEDVIEQGMSKLASISSSSAPASKVVSDSAPVEAAPEEVKPVSEDESDDDMGFGLFD